jgi:hypothetical protein
MLWSMMPPEFNAAQPFCPRSLHILAEHTAQLARRLDLDPGPFATPAGEDTRETLTRAQMATQTALLWVFALGCQRAREGELRECSASPAGESRGLAVVLKQIDQLCQDDHEAAACVRQVRALLDCESQDGPREAYSTTTYLAYWFEQLWAQLDRQLRHGRGGYFTPWPLVQYIVRSVDQTLRRDLGIADGLAPGAGPLRIVDPACGSGVFLLGVLEHLRGRERNACGAEEGDRWLGDFVADRLWGADLLPACGGAAEILVEMESGGDWSALRTNLLEDVETSRRLFTGRIPVIIGNPPYANFGRHNRGPWIREQLRTYTCGLNEKKHNLSDDFIKFLRWGQYWIEQAGSGVLAMVTSNTYLEGLTHRTMRASLAETFHYIDVLDLHGNRRQREITPQGARDENVFGIQQGVAISLFVRAPDGKRPRAPGVRYAELWGTAEQKLRELQRTDAGSLAWQTLTRDEPGQAYAPVSRKSPADYSAWPRLDEVFGQYVSGVQTKWDAHFVGFTRAETETRMRLFLEDAAEQRFPPQTPTWLVQRAKDVAYNAECLRPYMVAPWDVRWVYYEPRLLGRSRAGVLQCLGRDNPALVFMRQCDKTALYDHLLVTPTLVSDRVFYNAHGAPFVAPIWTERAAERAANFQPTYLRALQDRIELEWSASGGKSGVFGVHDVLHWIYARLWSPSYRTRYRAELGRDFPRVPWPADAHEFRAVCAAGHSLVTLHCELVTDLCSAPPSAVSGDCAVSLDGAVSLNLSRPVGTLGAGFPRRTDDGTVWLDRGCGWCEWLEEEVWLFRLGGYAVLSRWLKQRRGRELTVLDQQRWMRLVQAIRETRRWLEAIDALIDHRLDHNTA